MDVDAARKKSHSDASCFRCGKIGHWGKNCPDRFDIRNLTTDEVQEVLEGRLAQLDVVTDNPDRLAESAPTEDFSEFSVLRMRFIPVLRKCGKI
jgi:hypothetical protein